MKLIDLSHLSNTPYHLTYRHFATEQQHGFYHCHHGIELLYILQGTGRIVLERQVVEIVPGTLVMFQPFQLHNVQLDIHPDRPYERWMLALEPTVFEPVLHSFPVLQRFMRHLWRNQLERQVFIVDPERLPLLPILQHYEKRSLALPPHEQQEAFSLLVMQVLDILYALEPKSKKEAAAARRMTHSETIMQKVEERYQDEFTLEDLSRDLHLSRSHISRVFRLETGTSLSEYIVARRIRQACWLLSTSDMAIEHVGLRVGLPNASYFSQVFKRSIGVTPHHYRLQTARLYEGHSSSTQAAGTHT